MFSGGIERDHWHKVIKKLVKTSEKLHFKFLTWF